MNKYTELKSKHQKEIDAFPFGFAFNKDQYDRMMSDWGFKPTQRSNVMYLEAGCFIRKSDYEAMHEMFDRHEAERKEAMKDDDYLYQMFSYELANHEYGYTYDLTDTLEALGLTIDEVNADPRMADALKRAIAAQEGLIMYTKGRNMSEEKPKPFTVICNNCGSHDVTVTAFEHYDLGIKCHNCGAYLNYGSYNEREYYEDD